MSDGNTETIYETTSDHGFGGQWSYTKPNVEISNDGKKSGNDYGFLKYIE